MKKILFYAFFLSFSPVLGETKEENSDDNKSQTESPDQVYLTSKEYYNDYLKDPRLKTEALKGLTIEQKVDVAEQAFKDNKYMMLKSTVILQLWKNFGITFFAISWMVAQPIIIQPIMKAIVNTFFSNIDNHDTFRKDSVYSFLRILGSMGGLIYPKLLVLDQNEDYDRILNTHGIQATNVKKLRYLAQIHYKYNSKADILAEALSMALFQMILFFMVTPNLLSLSIATLWAMLSDMPVHSTSTVLFIALIFSIPKFMKYDTLIIRPIKFLLSSKAMKADIMEGSELLFVRKRAEGLLTEEQTELIIEAFIDARKNPEKMAYLWNFVSVVVALPSKEEMDQPQDTKLITDARNFLYYPEEGQELARRIAVRCKHGVRMNPILIEGPPGGG